jgi:hypothetical protein
MPMLERRSFFIVERRQVLILRIALNDLSNAAEDVQYISISIHFKWEVARWKMKWAIEVQKPRILSETLAELDSFLYSTIGRMLLTLIYM